MSHPIITLSTQEKVGRIMDVLKNSSHNGYPVVDDAGRDQSTFSVGCAHGIPTERIPIGVRSVGKYSGCPHHHHCCSQSGPLCFFFIFSTYICDNIKDM